jgi:predicted DNA-binding protein (MmcQ/YjbR family)
MHIEQLRAYCLQKKGVTEGFPFDEETLVFKVVGKIFALTGVSASPCKVNLKMDKAFVEEWRERYEAIQPGYHMNKAMWNTIQIENSNVPKKEIEWLIDHSYDEVVKKLTKKDKASLLVL